MPVILCLDPGTAHTGVAISEEGILVTPLSTIFEKSPEKLIGRIIPFLAQYAPDTVVIGVPDHGPIIHFVDTIKEKLATVFSGNIVLHSEDLSSRTARSVMREAGKTLAKKKADEHQTAAAIILQDYLESI